MSKTFLAINFGCRVNAAETNQWSQTFIEQGFVPTKNKPDIIFVNTCAITKKGEKESLSKIRILQKQYPKAKIIVSGCANFSKLSNVDIVKNREKEEKLKKLESFYSQKIGDKYTPYKRFMLKVQSGCTQNCSYCIVPQKRPYHFSLPISDAIKTIKKIENDYDEIIITGVNLNQYQYGFSNLIEKILKETKIKLISFGSIPLNCIDDKFLKLIKNYKLRIKNFFHIPIQSGSDHILKLMHRPYDREKIIKTFTSLREVKRRSNPDGIATSANWRTRDDTIDFGTDIIVGFPTETKKDFQDTLDICKQIGFKKIHTFRYSPRPDTEAKDLFESSPKITKEELKSRSVKIRNAIRTS